MMVVPYQIDHLKTLSALRDRLAMLKASPQPELRTEEIAQVNSVIATYERLYRPNIIDCTPRRK